jgi:hypothetical protein
LDSDWLSLSQEATIPGEAGALGPQDSLGKAWGPWSLSQAGSLTCCSSSWPFPCRMLLPFSNSSFWVFSNSSFPWRGETRLA